MNNFDKLDDMEGLSHEDIQRAKDQANQEARRRTPFFGQPRRTPVLKTVTLGQYQMSIDVAILPMAGFLSRFGFQVGHFHAGEIIPRDKGDQPRIQFCGDPAWVVEIAKLNESYAYEKSVAKGILAECHAVDLTVSWNRVRGIVVHTLWWNDLHGLLDYSRWIQDRFGIVAGEEVPPDPKLPKHRGIPLPPRPNIMRSRNR